MSEHDFVMWLNGWVELNGGAQPTAAQWKMITEHLGTVFKKVTPPLAVPPNPFQINLDKIPFNDPLKVQPIQPWYHPQPQWQPGILGKDVITC